MRRIDTAERASPSTVGRTLSTVFSVPKAFSDQASHGGRPIPFILVRCRHHPVDRQERRYITLLRRRWRAQPTSSSRPSNRGVRRRRPKVRCPATPSWRGPRETTGNRLNRKTASRAIGLATRRVILRVTPQSHRPKPPQKGWLRNQAWRPHRNPTQRSPIALAPLTTTGRDPNVFGSGPPTFTCDRPESDPAIAGPGVVADETAPR